MLEIKKLFSQEEYHWTASSSIHVSKVFNGTVETDKDKVHLASKALEFLLSLGPPTMLVNAEEYMAVLFADFQQGYTQTTPSGLKNTKNPTSGNYYTPVATFGDLLILVRGWHAYGESYSVRVRLVKKKSVTTSNGLAEVEDEVESAVNSVSPATTEEAAKAVEEEASSIFDFTPTPRAKARKKIRLKA